MSEPAWIETVPESEADPELSSLYEQVRDPVANQLDNIMAVHSLHPAGLKAHFDLYVAAMRGTPGLRGAERETIALVVSQHNDCHY